MAKEKGSVEVQKGFINPNPPSRQTSNEFSRAFDRAEQLRTLERNQGLDYHEPKK